MISNEEGLVLIKWDNIIGPYIKMKYPDINLNNNEILNIYISHVMDQNPIEFLTMEHKNKIYSSYYNKDKNEVLVLMLDSNKNINLAKDAILKKMAKISSENELTIDDLKKELIMIDEIIEMNQDYKTTNWDKNFENNEINKIKQEINDLKGKYEVLSDKIDRCNNMIHDIKLKINDFIAKYTKKSEVLGSIIQ
ncbi:MAG: hypothetical protein ACTSWR_02440 [Candidatus Helarchaeota archaeon]